MRFIVFIVTLFFIISCSPDFAGLTTEQGNPQITALILDSLNNPVSDIPVTLLVIPPDDTTDDDSLNNYLFPANAIKISTVKSSRDGRCSFIKLASGSYRIVATDSVRNMSVTSENIPLTSSNDSPCDTLVLQKSGRIQGVVIRSQTFQNTNLQHGFIQIRIFELDRSFSTPVSGVYFFDSLPYGRYTIYYYASDFKVAHVDNIKVLPGKTTIIDTVSLEMSKLSPPVNFRAQYDTSNAVIHFFWSPINNPNHWYYKIRRDCIENPALDKDLKTTTTQISDTLLLIPDKTNITYVIYSVDYNLYEGYYSAPIKIVVSR